MKKSMILVLISGAILICASIASLLAKPAQASKTRKVSAGRASLLVPLHLPVEVSTGTPVYGSVLMGSKDECDTTYDRFTGIYWSERDIPGSALLPAPAYEKVSEQSGEKLDLGSKKTVQTRTIKLSAVKPCGKIVEENLVVVDLYCSSSKTHYAIVGMQDPFMTKQKIVEIAKSLKCS